MEASLLTHPITPKNSSPINKSVVALLLVKEHSNRLPGKNVMDFNGLPMFLWNLRKCVAIFDRVYVSSDSYYILRMAVVNGAIAIHRGQDLVGDVPDIPVYQHAMSKIDDASGVVAVHGNNPTLEKNLIATTKKLIEGGVPEVMTCYHTTGS